MFRIPAKKDKPFAWIHPVSNRNPIVVIPISVAAVVINQHVVNKVVNIKQGFNSGIRTAILPDSQHPPVNSGFGGRISQTNQCIPGLQCTFCRFRYLLGLSHLNDIPFRLFTTQVCLAKIIVHPLGGVVQTPIEPINKQMGIPASTRHMAHF